MSSMNPQLREQLCAHILSAARQVYGAHLRGAILKGSCHEGDFIPHYSDIDIHIFVSDDQLLGPRVPRLEHAIAFQRAIGTLRPADYEVSGLQIYFLGFEAGYPRDWVKPWPGTYGLLCGELPPRFTEVSTEAYLERAHQHLSWFFSWTDDLLGPLAVTPDERLADLARQLGAILKPMTYVVGTLLTEDPARVWRLPLEQALALAEPAVSPSGSLSAFFGGLHGWPPSPERARILIDAAYQALLEVRTWYRSVRVDIPRFADAQGEETHRPWG